jgi:hypothetical protein
MALPPLSIPPQPNLGLDGGRGVKPRTVIVASVLALVAFIARPRTVRAT